MKKGLKKPLAGMLILILVLTQTVCIFAKEKDTVGDSYGDNFKTATEIQIGREVTGNIEKAGDKDLFKFTPRIAGEYKIEVYDAGFVPSGQLYNSREELLDSYHSNDLIYSFTISYRLNSGESYYIRIKPKQGNDTGSYKIKVSGVNLAPTRPTNLTVQSKTDSTISLTWDEAIDDTNVAGYSIYRYGQLVGTVASTSFTDTGLDSNAAYEYIVTAFDTDGNISDESDALLVTTDVRLTPSGLKAVSITETSVRLTWAPPTGGAKVKAYEIYRDGIRLKAETIPSTTIAGLIPGRIYTFSVKAIDEAGNLTGSSNILEITTLTDTQAPTAPTNLTVSSVTESAATLTWTAATDNAAVARYQIYRDGVRIASSSNPTFTATRLIPGRTYTFTVNAYDVSGNISEQTPAVSVTTPDDTQPPTAPTGLIAADVSDTTVTLAWGTATDNAGVSGYVIYRDGSKIATISGTSYTATGLVSGKTYKFEVRAYDVVNNISPDSSVVNITTK
ncbi:MAG: fibronectin type III domain-containing protein [Clostridia bacterium]|nr:fibronectin type III domain-containing protein [Clostridia bacterium]